MFFKKSKPTGIQHAFRGASRPNVQQDPRLQRFKSKIRKSLKFITKASRTKQIFSQNVQQQKLRRRSMNISDMMFNKKRQMAKKSETKLIGFDEAEEMDLTPDYEDPMPSRAQEESYIIEEAEEKF